VLNPTASACELNRDHIVSLDQLALIAFEKGDFELGIEYTTRILAIQPDNAAAWLNRGTGYRVAGHYPEAEADLTRAIELQPDNTLAYSERAISRLYLDLKDDALADANKAVELDESQLYTRLFVARYSGQFGIAVADASVLLEREGVTPYLLSSRGLAYVELGQFEPGMADLNATLEAEPQYSAGYDRRGYAYTLLEDYERAEADLDQALEGFAGLPPQARAELHYHRALLFKAQGELETARA
jgi:tetratricopeptide (TPR) repeat protein